MTMDKTTMRFLEMRAWIRSLGACPMCSGNLAISCVEHELSHAREPAVVVCDYRRKKSCSQLVKDAWATRPRTNEVKS